MGTAMSLLFGSSLDVDTKGRKRLWLRDGTEKLREENKELRNENKALKKEAGILDKPDQKYTLNPFLHSLDDTVKSQGNPLKPLEPLVLALKVENTQLKLKIQGLEEKLAKVMARVGVKESDLTDAA